MDAIRYAVGMLERDVLQGGQESAVDLDFGW